jgi:hypothetical protein
MPPIPRPLGVPEVLSGELTTDDMHMSDGPRVCDNYLLHLTAGQPVTIVVRGGTHTGGGYGYGSMDMYAILYFNRVEVTRDDDSAGSLNPRIVFTPSVSGTYLLRVTTFGSGLSLGTYTVETFQGEQPSAI